MGAIIGQDKIINVIDKLVETGKFPQFIILEGAKGSGRKLIAEYISKKLEAILVKIDDLKIAPIREMIKDSKEISGNKVYLLPNADMITRQAESALLKLVEDPPECGYIIMTVTTRDNILPTILSRATIYVLDQYTQDELKQFTDSKLKLHICNTPGQIEEYEDYEVEEMYKFAQKILSNIDKISILNLFNIPKYIDINDKNEGYNLDIILNTLDYLLYVDSFSFEYTKLCIKRMSIIAKYRKMFDNKSVNKQMCIDNMLLELKGV